MFGRSIRCYSTEMEWVEINDKGKLVAFTCIVVVPPFMIKEGFDRKYPYCSGVVELEEGVRVVARLEGVDTNKPEIIRIGTPLTVTFLHRGEGENSRTFLAFQPMNRGKSYEEWIWKRKPRGRDKLSIY